MLSEPLTASWVLHNCLEFSQKRRKCSIVNFSFALEIAVENHVIIATSSFSESSGFKMFSVHINSQPRSQGFSLEGGESPGYEVAQKRKAGVFKSSD